MNKKISLLSLLILSFSSLIVSSAVEKHQIDPSHSGINFKIRHFFTPVPGSFSNFEGLIEFDSEDLKNSKVEAEIAVSSVNTNNKKRDGHLMNEDFFTADKYPAMTFKSSKWVAAGKNKFKVTGDLTIIKTTKSVVLDVTLLGMGKNHKGDTISGWAATTTIDRTDFGITYGAGIVGNEVTIEINIEAAKI